MNNGYEARIDNILVESDNTTVTIQVSLRTGEFIPGETVKIRDENTYAIVNSSVVPQNYTTTSNYEYEFALN